MTGPKTSEEHAIMWGGAVDKDTFEERLGELMDAIGRMMDEHDALQTKYALLEREVNDLRTHCHVAEALVVEAARALNLAKSGWTLDG